MAIRRERVVLQFDEGFTARLPLLSPAAADLSRRLARLDATWEPHDWSEFD